MKIAIFWILLLICLFMTHKQQRAEQPIQEPYEIRISQARYLLTEFGYTPKQIAEIINP